MRAGVPGAAGRHQLTSSPLTPALAGAVLVAAANVEALVTTVAVGCGSRPLTMCTWHTQTAPALLDETLEVWVRGGELPHAAVALGFSHRSLMTRHVAASYRRAAHTDTDEARTSTGRLAQAAVLKVRPLQRERRHPMTTEQLRARETATGAADARSDLVAAGLALWMVGGVFVDGWAHINLDSTQETFFTPWHGMLYSGFLALTAWMALPLIRDRSAPLTQRMPAGSGLGYVGVLLFGIGGFGDAVWHQILGIEVGVDALLSPTHLLLLTGGLLLLTGPLRAAWRRPNAAPDLRTFLPALVSITLTSALLSFFFAYAWGGLDLTPAAPVPAAALDEHAPGHGEAELLIAAGILARLITTALLIAPLLLLLRRFRPPVGTATILFTVISTLMFAILGERPPALLVPPIVAGLAADVALARLGPGLLSRAATYTLAVLLTLVLWVGHFAALGATEGLGWTPELWGGSIVMAALTALGLAVLVFPPPVPAPEP